LLTATLSQHSNELDKLARRLAVTPLMSELDEFANVLELAKSGAIRWYLAIDY